MPVRQTLLDAMRERRLTADDLARLLGRDRTSVSKYIHGRVDPPASVALRLELILGVPARTLFADLLAPAPRAARSRHARRKVVKAA